MRYQEALDYIWGLVNFETHPPETREPYTLDRMHALMARLDDPQHRVRAIHVAGTKGKGSTAAMIERVLRAAGYRTALYSSPHLHDPRERFQIDGRPIAEAQFIALVEQIRPHVDALGSVTTFEALTAMAFLLFAEAGIDLAVIEVGLGGRLDATNLVTPLLSVITPLGLEHTAVLGETIEEIAAEKGGIIKAGVPVVTSGDPPAAVPVLRELAAQRDAPLTVIPERWRGDPTAVTLEGQRFDLVAVAGREISPPAPAGEVPGQDDPLYRNLHLSLLGTHQLSNALLAIGALHQLRAQGIDWSESALREGLATVEWPARVELLQRRPLVVADAAHTAESAAALVATLQAAAPQGWRQSILILGISRDKKIEQLLPALGPVAGRVILTRSRHPRAADPERLAAAPVLAGRVSHLTPDVPAAVRQALAEAGPEDLIVATGSLFVAAEARAYVHERAGRPDASP